MIKYNKSLTYQAQRGLTLVELMISTGLLFMIMVMGTAIFSNIQSHLKLAEKESRMQQFARDAITKMTRELRQARRSAVWMPPEDTTNYDQIFFTVPEQCMGTETSGFCVGQAAGTPTGEYNLVRYWYAEDETKPGSGLMSLYRAHKKNTPATSYAISGTPAAFADNRTRLLKEAAAVLPGTRTYFKWSDSDPNKPIEIVLEVATYMNKPNASFQYQMERTFRIETRVELRS